MNTDNFTMQLIIHLETAPAVYTHLLQFKTNPIWTWVQPTSRGGLCKPVYNRIRAFTRIQFSLILILNRYHY